MLPVAIPPAVPVKRSESMGLTDWRKLYMRLNYVKR